MKAVVLETPTDFCKAPSWGDNFRCARSLSLGGRTGQNLCPAVAYL